MQERNRTVVYLSRPRTSNKHTQNQISGDGQGNRCGPGCLAYRPAVCGPNKICHVTPDVLQEPVSNGQKIKFVEALRSHFSVRGW